MRVKPNMTKRELIEYTAKAQREDDERHASWAERMATYDRCKDVSRDNGFGDWSFRRQIWDNAIRENGNSDYKRIERF